MKKISTMMIVLFFAVMITGSQADDKRKDKCPIPEKVKERVCLNCCGVDQEYADAITDRLQTGFLNYNSGYIAWLEWCDELYDENAYYNVYGHRFTLDEYKRLMGAMFEQYEISLGGTGETAGDIGNIITDSIKGMTAIQYDVSFRKKGEEAWVPINTMEFVQFRKDDEFGAKVMEGWALSSAEIEPDPAVIYFWMNPANGWDVLLERVATWE